MFGFDIVLHGATLEVARRRKARGPLEPDIGLRRTNISHIRRRLNTLFLNVHGARRHGCSTRLLQQLLYPPLGLVILPFAEVFVAHPSFGIDEVFSWPGLIVERIPDLVATVERYGIRDI